MSSDLYPIDHSGFDPTGMGDAPSARSVREQEMKRFRSQQQSASMQFNDPWVRAATSKLMSSLIKDGNTPDEARRKVFQSRGGQAAMDAFMLARRSGGLGQGDPVNYAHQIATGVASGGFNARFTGTMEGENLVGSGRVSGQGALSERVSGSFQQSLMRNLYGEGLPQARKLYGFDMTETAGVFNKLASRGVIGNVAMVERNAPIARKLAAERDATSDESVKAALSGVNFSEDSSEEERIQQLQTVIEATSDPKQKRALEKVLNQKDAVVISEAESKKVARLVDNAVESMSSLSDIYGELNSDELFDKLEEISGTKLTTNAQFRQAREMVSQIKGAAEIAGIDPKAYAEYASFRQAQLNPEISRAMGFDGTSTSKTTAVNAVASREIEDSALVDARVAQDSVNKLRAAGIEVSDAPTSDELAEDKRQGVLEFMTDFAAVGQARGGINRFSGEQKDRVQGLLDEFDATKNILDPQDQYAARETIRDQLEGEYEDFYGVDFESLADNAAAQADRAKSYTDPTLSRKMFDDIASGRQTAINVAPVTKMLKDMGIAGTEDGEGALKKASILRDKVGSVALGDLIEASNTEASPEARLQRQRNILSDTDLSAEEVDEFMKDFFDDSGQVKDTEGFQEVAKYMSDSSKGGDQSAYARRQKADKRLATMFGSDARTKLSDKAGGVSFNSVLDALLTEDGASGISDPESMVLALQALDAAGMELPEFDDKGTLIPGDTKSAKGSYATGINLSQGLNADALEKLTKVKGSPLDLYKKFGFESEEALMEASTSDSELRENIIKTLRSDEDLNLAGGIDNMTAITNEAYTGLKQDENSLEGYLRKLGASKLVNSALAGEEALGGLTEEGDFDASKFATDKFEDTWFGGAKMGEGGENLGKSLVLADVVNKSRGNTFGALKDLDENQGISSVLGDQLTELMAAKEKKGGDAMVKIQGKEGEEEVKIDDAIAKFKEAIDRLAGTYEKASESAAQSEIGEMTVRLMRVYATEPGAN
jgi:hypothetical protein